MKSVRIRVIFLASWLALFCFISGLLDPVAINPITIGLVVVMLIVALVIPDMSRATFWAITLVPITALLVTKFWVEALSGRQAIFLAIVEICAIAVTISLARWVSSALIEFENAVTKITIGKREKKLETEELEQGLIYREVRRARNHERPLAIISVGIDPKSIEPNKERMVVEIQRSMMEQYKLRVLEKMLCTELEDCAVIAKDTNHYLAVLPETMPEELQVVVTRLRQKAVDQVGIELKVGTATLPHDSYTFEGLVEKATRAMEYDREAQPYIVVDEHALETRVKQ